MKQDPRRQVARSWLLVSLSSVVGLLCYGVWMSTRARDIPEWSEVTHSIRARFPDVHQITTEELADWLSDGSRQSPILLDVRSPEEYLVSHLLNALPAKDYSSSAAVLGDRDPDTPIVVYCSVGYRSSQLARVLSANGFSNVSNLEGSIFKWANEDRPLYRGTERVRVVHPYDTKWGRLLAPAFHESNR